MEKVLSAMKNQFSEFNAKFDSVDAELKSVKNEVNVTKWIIE